MFAGFSVIVVLYELDEMTNRLRNNLNAKKFSHCSSLHFVLKA